MSTISRRCTALALAGTLLCLGCSKELDTTYGRCDFPGAESVNGTAALAALLKEKGHTVTARSSLSPAVKEKANTIVWFPDNFDVPSKKVVSWLNEWLQDDPEHTLIYVGRDFEAAADYWTAVIPGAPAAQAVELRRQLNEARIEASARRGKPQDAKCEWFHTDYTQPQQSITTLSGPWSTGVDPKKIEMAIEGRLKPANPSDSEELLASGQDVLVSRISPTDDGGQIILVTNGSFLLNYPLVNHEHRKLAGRLVTEIGPPGNAVFLQGREPEILDEEPSISIPSGLEVFAIWPLNLLLLHLAALGMVFCLARWPIFGRPRLLPREAASDFGRHVDALGELLENTRDRGYAMNRLLNYQQSHQGESSAARPPALPSSPVAPRPDHCAVPGALRSNATTTRNATPPPINPQM